MIAAGRAADVVKGVRPFDDLRSELRIPVDEVEEDINQAPDEQRLPLDRYEHHSGVDQIRLSRRERADPVEGARPPGITALAREKDLKTHLPGLKAAFNNPSHTRFRGDTSSGRMKNYKTLVAPALWFAKTRLKSHAATFPACTRGASRPAPPWSGERALPEAMTMAAHRRRWLDRVGNARTKTGVNSNVIAVGGPVRQEQFQMPRSHRDQEIQALPSDGPYQPLADGVCFRRSHWRL